jgi:hypothetical protein
MEPNPSPDPPLHLGSLIHPSLTHRHLRTHPIPIPIPIQPVCVCYEQD